MKNELDEFAGSVTVIVSSCDAFFDCWRPFAYFFRKFWGDCPFPVRLLVNELDLRSDFIQPLRVGPDRGWATSMMSALRQIETPYILYFQEDYFLTAPVQTEQLARDIAQAMEEKAAALCFYDLSLLEPSFAETKERFGVVPQDSKGRTRLQATLWQKDVFASLLRPEENAWNMEARGSERTQGLHILSYARDTPGPIPYLMSGIVRGLWTPEALALCRAHGVRIRPHFRPTLAHTKWARRWRRALGRVRLALALAAQRGRPVELGRID